LRILKRLTHKTMDRAVARTAQRPVLPPVASRTRAVRYQRGASPRRLARRIRVVRGL